MQELMLKLALQIARDDYELAVNGSVRAWLSPRRLASTRAAMHQRIVALRSNGLTIHRTAELAGCSVSQVKQIWAMHGG